MPPPSSSAALHLQVLTEPFFVVQLGSSEEMAPCIVRELTGGTGGFFSVTRTKEEVSIVGEAYKRMPQKYEEQCAWKCIRILGPMEHRILAELTGALKEAKVPIFAVSTWNTDYVLVARAMAGEAVAALERDGWVFVQGAGKSRVARL